MTKLNVVSTSAKRNRLLEKDKVFSTNILFSCSMTFPGFALPFANFPFPKPNLKSSLENLFSTTKKFK